MWEPKVNEVLAVGAAFKLWRTFGFSAPQDLVLEDLALVRGVLVVDAPLESSEARLVRNGSRGLIRVRDTIPEPGRRRFAIAHELGHWEIHANISQLTICTSEDMIDRYKASIPEIEANIFAAELLMPIRLFEPRIAKTLPSFNVIRELADYFQTSLTATALRFVDLTPEACAFVISEENTIKWWRRSRSFPFWLNAGSQLPEHSVASRFFNGAKVPREPQDLQVGHWFSVAANSPKEISEEVFVFERYHQTASFLWLH